MKPTEDEACWAPHSSRQPPSSHHRHQRYWALSAQHLGAYQPLSGGLRSPVGPGPSRLLRASEAQRPQEARGPPRPHTPEPRCGSSPHICAQAQGRGPGPQAHPWELNPTLRPSCRHLHPSRPGHLRAITLGPYWPSGGPQRPPGLRWLGARRGPPPPGAHPRGATFLCLFSFIYIYYNRMLRILYIGRMLRILPASLRPLRARAPGRGDTLL